MEPFGGFDHNAQALKIVTSLERHYAEFDGLNLTWETLEGIAKHNGPVLGDLPHALATYAQSHDLELHTHASAEAQVAAVSDDIAYNNHDLDDGLRAGLFNESDITNLPIVGACFANVDKKYPNLDPNRRRHEALRRVFGVMVEDVIETSRRLIAKSGATTAQEIRDYSAPVIQFSPELFNDLKQIRAFLFENMYRSDRVNVMRARSEQVVIGLFDAFMNDAALLPDQWRITGDDKTRALLISDYLAGMTDGYAEKRFTELHAGT